ncbi:hypothetical protein HPB47_015808 [Ixodes persulcatus]|uniref:Uncharacterized protein n=1 Tax=Ixodes persulcatus TaxID=34615 RepID=A0AC60QSM4_IXOPE|nr:hypothetical protein HPB47_015808 [Ixodes persulcatus]
MEVSGPTIGATQQSPDLVSDIAELRREVQNLTTIVSELRRESRDHAQSSQQHSGRLPSRADSSSHGVTRCTLQVAQLHRRDLNASLTCRASDHNGTYSVASSVTLDLYPKPVGYDGIMFHVNTLRPNLEPQKHNEHDVLRSCK